MGEKRQGSQRSATHVQGDVDAVQRRERSSVHRNRPLQNARNGSVAAHERARDLVRCEAASVSDANDERSPVAARRTSRLKRGDERVYRPEQSVVGVAVEAQLNVALLPRAARRVAAREHGAGTSSGAAAARATHTEAPRGNNRPHTGQWRMPFIERAAASLGAGWIVVAIRGNNLALQTPFT